ncbi:AcrR family transcriptional regulator [Catenulispora sp. GP43]|uniref:TetR/AcrR family transcriptional regulator n=1 Tax=Catenulispora sp. GP43 TaxID=3156263 RepID=UPI00351761A4
MRGRLPARPLAEVADAAVRVFLDKGFRPAGISDVARELGLSHGAVYTYADSKQALLYLALLRVLDPEAVAKLSTPVVAPPAEGIVEVVKVWAAARGGLDSVSQVLSEAPAESAEQARDELARIVDGLYGFVEDNSVALKLFARCSEDLPEMTQWYYIETRRGLLEVLGRYLRARIDAGVLRPVPDVPVAARFIVETIAWFAMHRHGDPDSAMLSDADCRRSVMDLVAAAFAR